MKKIIFIFFVVGLLLAIINFFVVGVLGISLLYPINWFLFEILDLFNTRGCGEGCWGILMIVDSILFIILLTFLGFVIGLVKWKLKNIRNYKLQVRTGNEF
jgi:hypothetical protein